MYTLTTCDIICQYAPIKLQKSRMNNILKWPEGRMNNILKWPQQDWQLISDEWKPENKQQKTHYYTLESYNPAKIPLKRKGNMKSLRTAVQFWILAFHVILGQDSPFTSSSIELIILET